MLKVRSIENYQIYFSASFRVTLDINERNSVIKSLTESALLFEYSRNAQPIAFLIQKLSS